MPPGAEGLLELRCAASTKMAEFRPDALDARPSSARLRSGSEAIVAWSLVRCAAHDEAFLDRVAARSLELCTTQSWRQENVGRRARDLESRVSSP